MWRRQEVLAMVGVASWPRFAAMLATTVVCFAWNSVTDWESLARVLVSAAAVLLFAACAEVLSEHMLKPRRSRAARRKPTSRRRVR
jgi:peptidoglycan/LPS O-acetylase OafA/YrhL